MAPKYFPPELLFEIAAFVPAKKAVPNAFSSCRLLHSFLLQCVTKWKQRMEEDRIVKHLKELSAQINDLRTETNKKFEDQSAEFNKKLQNLSAEVQDLRAELNQKHQDLSTEVHDLRAELNQKHQDLTTEVHDLRAELNQKAFKIVIEVPAGGYSIQQAANAGMLDLKSGKMRCDVGTDLSLAKAIEIGMLNPHSMTVRDSSHGMKKELHLDEALKEGILDENGGLKYSGRRMSLLEGIDKKFAKCAGATAEGLGKKTIQLELNASEMALFGKSHVKLPPLEGPNRQVILSSLNPDLDEMDLRPKKITASSVMLVWNRGTKPPRGDYRRYEIQKKRDDIYENWSIAEKVPYKRGMDTYEYVFDDLKPKTPYSFCLKMISNNETLSGRPSLFKTHTHAAQENA